MTTPTNPLDVTVLSVADLRAFAREMRAKFADGQRMSVRDSDVVHAVDNERWLMGELVPQPLCHTPVYGWSPGALRPVRRPVNCEKCRRKLASPEERLLPYGEFQPALFTYIPPKTRQAADVA
ncbi:hypothetical protein ACFPC0_10800 [Streptomyces andamanensis]|uniref:Uncharacterized protein n=1 Tax=Streptomyces andamanensis TaxID=1565035 RepID=A0ABV8TCK9_9ACTN